MIAKKLCAYCGLLCDKLDREHVFPKNLYPLSKAKSKVQRLTVPACDKCNNSWANDEVHFRNVLVVAGDPATSVRTELWKTTIDRSFSQIDGYKRLSDLIAQLKSITIGHQDRQIIYPGNDARVLRVVRKIVRGLHYYHKLFWPLSDDSIFVDVLKYEVPPHFLDEMELHDRDKDIVEYRFKELNEYDIQTVWIITFFQTVPFIAIVNQT